MDFDEDVNTETASNNSVSRSFKLWKSLIQCRLQSQDKYRRARGMSRLVQLRRGMRALQDHSRSSINCHQRFVQSQVFSSQNLLHRVFVEWRGIKANQSASLHDGFDEDDSQRIHHENGNMICAIAAIESDENKLIESLRSQVSALETANTQLLVQLQTALTERNIACVQLNDRTIERDCALTEADKLIQQHGFEADAAATVLQQRTLERDDALRKVAELKEQLYQLQRSGTADT